MLQSKGVRVRYTVRVYKERVSSSLQIKEGHRQVSASWAEVYKSLLYVYVCNML